MSQSAIITRRSRPEPKPGILDITPYKPGKSKAEGIEHPVKLSSNENILGFSPKAHAAYVAAAERMNIYPDGRADTLRRAVADYFHLEPGDNIVMGQYGFGAYSIGARACQGEVRMAPEPHHRLSVEQMLARVDERTRIVFVTQPGNPTGTYLTKDELTALHQGLPPDVVLVIDTAYAEFADDPAFDDGFDLARGSQNVVVTRTFSKIYGLAALRVGWAYGPEPVVQALDRIRLPFNVVLPGQDAAIAALKDQDFQTRSLDLVHTWLPWLTQQLGGLGLDITPSHANFLLVTFPREPGRTAAEAEAFLAERGLIVRGVANYGLPDSLRITVGLEEHNRAVVDGLADFLKG